jgi:hypothetical protein
LGGAGASRPRGDPKPEGRNPREGRNPKLEGQLQNPPQHGNGHIQSEKELSPLLPHLLISLAINQHVPGARLFDSEESRKPGNETGKPIAKRLNTNNGQIKSQKELSPSCFLAPPSRNRNRSGLPVSRPDTVSKVIQPTTRRAPRSSSLRQGPCG